MVAVEDLVEVAEDSESSRIVSQSNIDVLFLGLVSSASENLMTELDEEPALGWRMLGRDARVLARI